MADEYYGGIADELASKGRYGDSMLMHVNPIEVEGLSSLVPITRNPHTGLPEAFWPLVIGAVLGATVGGVRAKKMDVPLWQGILGGAALGATAGSGLGAMAAPAAAAAPVGGAGTAAALTAQGASAANVAAANAASMANMSGGVLGGSALPGAGFVAQGSPALTAAVVDSFAGGANVAPAVQAAQAAQAAQPLVGSQMQSAAASAPELASTLGVDTTSNLVGGNVDVLASQPLATPGVDVSPTGGGIGDVGGIRGGINSLEASMGENPLKWAAGIAAANALVPPKEKEIDFGESSFEGDPTWSDRRKQPRRYVGASPGGRQRSYFGRV